jgi:Domain of unknown function (DUF4112)
MADPLIQRRPGPVLADRRQLQIERLRTLARLLDSAFQVPGTRYRWGLDALIGLVPGIGDAIGAVLSGIIILEAARLGASKATLARMMANVALDTIVGEIPVLGDLFDAGWKANNRNMALLEAQLQGPAATTRASRKVLFLLGAGLLLLLAGVFAAGAFVAHLVVIHLR